MLRLIFLSLLQSACLCSGQIFLKFALKKMGEFSFSLDFFVKQFYNFNFLFCGIGFTTAGILWMIILKNFNFSVAYPLSSLTYVFGMIAAMLFFGEQIFWTQWLGILLIMAGCYLIVS